MIGGGSTGLWGGWSEWPGRSEGPQRMRGMRSLSIQAGQ